jgi:membrane protein
MLKLKSVGGILKETASEWSNDAAPRLGAALAYYSLFSLGPLVMIAISVAGLVFGQEAVAGELFGQMRGLIGDEGAAAIQALVKSVHEPKGAGIAGAVGIATLLFGATGVVVQLKDALNTVWEVKPKAGSGIRVFLRKYVVSLAAVMGFGFLLMVSLVLSAALAAAGRFFEGWLPAPEALFHLANFAVTFSVLTLLIAGMFKYLPDVEQRFRDVLLGAAFTALLFMIGKFLIGLYLGKQSLGTTYGAAGSLVVLLVWIYYSAQIIFFGAEFTEVYQRRVGRAPLPSANAEPITAAQAAQEGRRLGAAGKPKRTPGTLQPEPT